MTRFFLILSLLIGCLFPVNGNAGVGKKIVTVIVISKAVKIGKAIKAAKKAKLAAKPSGKKNTSINSLPAAPNPKPKIITVSKSKYPESAQHIADAKTAGQPSVLTIDRSGAAANRRASLKKTSPQKGFDRDEYPPAMVKEGGSGASVRKISPSDNRGAGSCIGHQCRKIPDGGLIDIKVIP